MKDNTDSEPFLKNEASFEASECCSKCHYRQERSQLLISGSIVISLCLSVALNLILALGATHNGDTYDSSLKAAEAVGLGISTAAKSEFASLERDMALMWTWHGPYYSDNESEVFAMWEQVDPDPGVVALPDDFVEEKELPVAQRFPWDESKGIYLLNGYHNLHCLKVLSRSLHDFRTQAPLREPFEHSLHCLDTLRQDVLCNADDTPRWSGYAEMVSGVGQYRQCRDWGRLEAWAQENTACHRHLDLKDGENILERYKFCPEGSPYSAEVSAFFGDTPVTQGAYDAEGGS